MGEIVEVVIKSKKEEIVDRFMKDFLDMTNHPVIVFGNNPPKKDDLFKHSPVRAFFKRIFKS